VEKHQGAGARAIRLIVLSLRDSLLQISRLSACRANRFAKGFAGRVGTPLGRIVLAPGPRLAVFLNALSWFMRRQLARRLSSAAGVMPHTVAHRAPSRGLNGLGFFHVGGRATRDLRSERRPQTKSQP